MISTVNDYIVGALEGAIGLGAEGATRRPIMVYAPGANREKGLTTFPHIAVTLVGHKLNADRARPDVELFTASSSTGTVTVPKREASMLRARAVGGEVEPFAIEVGVNDKMVICVHHGDATGSCYEVALSPGAAESADEVCRSINYWAGDAFTASATEGGAVAISPRDAAWDFTLAAVDDSAYATLGLTEGTYSHLVQTGPASYSVTPYPVPVSLHYQVDVRTTTQEQMVALIPMVWDVFPPGHQAAISGHVVTFDHDETECLDELAKPIFWTAFRWWVKDAWLARRGGYAIAGQTDADITLDV
jgi:hypothetical protein